MLSKYGFESIESRPKCLKPRRESLKFMDGFEMEKNFFFNLCFSKPLVSNFLVFDCNQRRSEYI